MTIFPEPECFGHFGETSKLQSPTNLGKVDQPAGWKKASLTGRTKVQGALHGNDLG